MWKIYYDDGSTFSSEDGSWNDAPADGVLFVLLKRGDIVETRSGADHYLLMDDTVATTDDLGPLLRKWGVKFGRWTSIKRYEEIGRRVADDAARCRLGI